MQANAKGLGGGKQDKEARLAKERKREEKELKRMAKARGVKVGVVSGAVGTNALAPGVPPTTEEPKGINRPGWATVSSRQVPQLGGGESSRKSGWATVSSGARPGSIETTPQRQQSHGFRTAGFETLETTSITITPKLDDTSNIVGGISDMAIPSKSQWSSLGMVPPPPPPSSAAPPLPPTTLSPPPPHSALPPPPPPSWSPQPPPPPGPPSSHDSSVGGYMATERPPSPRSFHHRTVTPPRPRDDGRGRDWQGRSSYRGSQGYR